jgi:transcriptional regulator with XRE-family HTH domain
MPDIGETLREARMRRRIDMTEVEAATKIRAKYLRALENEEWDLLPGPTFVKTFLRTYAEYLGLDARNLVEEYKQRYERPTPQDLRPLGPPVAMRRRRRTPRPIITPGVILAVVGVLLLGALYALGRWGAGEDERPATTTERATTPEPTAAERREARERRERARRRAAARRLVRLRISAEGPVEVCLLDARGRRVMDAVTLDAGDTTRTFRSRRFRVTFGNGQAVMRVNGRRVGVPERPGPIGFSLRAGRRPVELSATARPVCS